MRSAVIEGLKMLAAYDLTFDYIGILRWHLEHVPILAERLPTLRIKSIANSRTLEPRRPMHP
jgi:L-fuconolactonase